MEDKAQDLTCILRMSVKCMSCSYRILSGSKSMPENEEKKKSGCLGRQDWFLPQERFPSSSLLTESPFYSCIPHSKEMDTIASSRVNRA